MSLTNATASFGVSANVPFSTFGTFPVKRSASLSLSSGTTPPNQADTIYAASYSVTSGSDVSIDLSGGTIKQVDGTTATFAKIGMIFVINTTTTGTAVLTVGGGTSAAVTALPTLGPGDFAAYGSNSTGLTVTNSTADVLKLSASAGTITCDILIIGRSV